MERSSAIFLNVDLVLDAETPLDPIAQALKNDASVLFCGQYGDGYRAVFEADIEARHADAAILALCQLVDALDGEAKRRWQACSRREFDIGFESSIGSTSLESPIEPETVTRVASLDAAIRITIHASPDDA